MAAREIFIVIPARGGSKGIPSKNSRLVGGRQLVAWSIETGLQLVSRERVLVSTESAEIADIARDSGASVVTRPASLAGDRATTESAMAHAIETVGAGDSGVVVLLQPTSPLRRIRTLEAVVGAVLDGATSALTVRRAHDFHWGVDAKGNALRRYRQRVRRQDMEPDFVETGSIYATHIEAFRRSGDRVCGRTALIEVDAWEAHETDDPADLEVLDRLATHWHEPLSSSITAQRLTT